MSFLLFFIFNALLIYSIFIVGRKIPLLSLLDRLLYYFLGYFILNGILVQVLSLFDSLTPFYMLTFAFLFALLSALASKSTYMFPVLNIKDYIASLKSFNELSLENKFLFLAFLFSILTLFFISSLNFPHTDSYHWEMPYYWLQNESIKPFVVLNFRTTSFSFLQEAQYLSFFAFLQMPEYSYIFSLLCYILIPFLVSNISQKVGFDKNAAFFAGILACSLTVVVRGAYDGSNDITTAFWFLVAIYFAVFARNEGAYTSANPLYLMLSILSFCVAVGIKNGTMLMLPVYAIFLFLMFGRYLFKVEVMKIIFVTFCAGMVLSGVIWLYISNFLWYEDVKGFDQNYKSVLGGLDLQSIKTRVIRGVLYMFSDFTYLPKNLEAMLLAIHKVILNFFAVSPVLPNEAGYYAYKTDSVPQRAAFGLFGSLFIIPIYFYIFTRFFSQRNILYKNKIAIAIFVTTTLSFLVYHAFLNWQPSGLFRLSFAFALVFAPLFAIIYSYITIRSVAVGFSILNLLLNLLLLFFISLSTSFVDSSDTLKKLTKFRKNTDSEFIFKNYTNTTEQRYLLKNFDDHEILVKISEYLKPSSSIAYFGHDEYFLFGKKLSNKVYSVIDHRLPEKVAIQRVRLSQDYVVLNSYWFDIIQQASDLLSKYEKVLEVRDTEFELKFIVLKKKT